MEKEIEVALDELREGWVELEVSGADFGDERLNKRYGKVLELMSKLPQCSFNQSSECLSEMLGAYRFISNEKVSVAKLLNPHREQILQRANGESTVLLIQDTTFLDMSDHLNCEDLKPLKITQMQKALWVHTTLGILPNGLPLGVFDAQFMSGKVSAGTSGSQRPIEDKQSRRWLAAVDNCEHLLGNNVRKIWLCDQEADIYELLEHIHGKGENYVIRSRWDRAIEEGPYYDFRTALANAPVEYQFELKLHRTFKRAARTAKLGLRFSQASVSAPEYKHHAVSLKSVPGYAVEVFELDPPLGEEPVHWKLLTNLKVESLDDALQIVDFYKKRWAIEELFKILKSGCRAEKAQFHTTNRLAKYITLSLIVAWRLYFLVHVNRLDPNAPAQSVLTSPELETLQLLLDDTRLKKKQRRMLIRTAAQAITQIAKLGGYLDRKSAPYPGIVVLWKGTMALAFSTRTLLAQKRLANS